MSDFNQLRKSLGTYIANYPPPSKDQNSKWLNQLNSLKKNSKEYKNVRERMVLCNGGFAMKYVMKYKKVLNDDVSIMDLFQEAMLGIIETIDTFDINLGTTFTTYAHFHVQKRIVDFIKHNKLVRAPRDIARNLKHVNEARSKLFSILNREPSTIEIISELKSDKEIELKEDIVNNILVLLELNSAGTEFTFINEFNEKIANNEQLTSTIEEDSELFRLMESSLLSRLQNSPELIQKIIKLRFGIGCDCPHSIEEINYMLDIDTQNVITLSPESDKHFLK